MPQAITNRNPPVRRILRIPREYLEAIPIGARLFPELFQFENGLRLVIHKYLTSCYGANWWDESLKLRRSTIHDYAEGQKTKRSYMPWIGDSSRTTVLPIHSVTLGQLEEIVKAYQSECIPELFPSLDFFTGRMEIIKRVRNLFSHMYPCITDRDVTVAKRDIKTLCEHIATKL